MKILTIDIETAPNLVYAFGLWDQNIPITAIIEPTVMLCWAAKWADEKRVEYRSVFHDGKEEMVTRAHELLDDADVVMHFNGRRFDVPHLNREFLEQGLLPPSPYKQLDLLETCKRQFKFPSNKLDYVSRALGLEGKAKHEGFGLWVKCMEDDSAAWSRMRKYNKQDVVLTEKLYHRIKPWIRNHPSYAAFAGKEVCPKCGGTRRERRGVARTALSTFIQWHCLDEKCGAWFRGNERQNPVTLREVA